MLDTTGGELGGEAFIIVLEYFSRFVQFSDEQPIYIPRARLVRLQDGGRFRIQFDLRASAIETVFIAPQYRMERFHFQRQRVLGNCVIRPG